MKSIVIAFALSSSIAAAALASDGSGQIVEMRTGPYYGNMVAITLNPAPANQPSCSTLGVRGHYLLDTSTPGCKAWLAVILSAHAAQKNVLIYGSGQCVAVGGFFGESIETIAAQ